ncbi:class I SAM-dependent methyltransferase [Kitasatospora sp. NPDC054939]
MTVQAGSDAAYWDARYAENARMWSGNPNPALVREVDGLAPGRVLELGCGEGADAVWLAGQGWQVTAVDVSAVALARAAGHAVDAGVDGRIDWQCRDLGTDFPEGSYDLVCAQFLHSPTDLPRTAVLRAAAAAVEPGGVLLVVGHAAFPVPVGGPAGDADRDGAHAEHSAQAGHGHGHDEEQQHGRHDHADLHLPGPQEVLADLALPEGGWEVLRSDEHELPWTAPDGRTYLRHDNTLKLRRLPA